jgi:methylmalonyl-CoA epimerase
MWHVAYHHAATLPVKPFEESWLATSAPTVDHIGIAVRDAPAAAAWMTGRLGFRVVHDESLADPPVRLVYVDAGNVILQFVEPTGAGRVDSFIEERGEGLHHLCLRVADVAAAASAIAPEDPGTPFRGGRGQLTCFLGIQPSGMVIELADAPVELAEGAAR